jgi:pimeloyl-ACP methyl ester carboxylesterase
MKTILKLITAPWAAPRWPRGKFSLTHIQIFLNCLLLLSFSLLGCSKPKRTPNGHSLHEAKFVTVNGVRLQYLDWGGRGDGLVFLHGLGDSPHAYDDLAPSFSDRFRVIAYARRGHGRSEAKGPYDNGTLVEDLRQLLDHLGIQRAVLAGYSLGGNEITAFAVRFPERVTNLIYLDCFDMSTPVFARHLQRLPLDTLPSAAHLASLEAFRAWFKQTWWRDTAWTPAMEAWVDDLVERRPDGSVRPVTDDRIEADLFKGGMAYSPPFAQVRAPMLAFVAHWYRDAYISPDAPEALRVKVENWLRDDVAPLLAERLALFKTASARVVEFHRTSHGALLFQRHDRILAEINSFLRKGHSE